MIELLVAIAIISILAALLIGVAATAGRTAREARTKSFVTRLHTLLIERYDLYRTRRVELIGGLQDSAPLRASLTTNGGIRFQDNFAPPPPTNPADPRVIAMARLAGMRELMKLEMPDRWSDIYGAQLPSSLQPIDFSVTPTFLFVNEAPTLWYTYAREYNRIWNRRNDETDLTNTTADLLRNQGAECLYLTIVYATGDGEARGLFKETDIGDTDGDGALEFLDGWGNPISYLRWAPGFESDAQPSFASIADVFADAEQETGGERGVDAVRILLTEDHDPLDLFRVDWANLTEYAPPGVETGPRGWRLTPLVVSAGADEELGIEFGNRLERTAPFSYTASANPYVEDIISSADEDSDEAGQRQRLGAIDSRDPEAYADNIHSHDIGSFTRAR